MMPRGRQYLVFGRAGTIALMCAAGVVFAQEPKPASGRDRSSFNLISERNIFDPNRSAGVERGEREEEPRQEPVVQSISLLGTMSYEKGQFAFFGGSSSEFRKVLKPEEKIAGFTITEIGANQVKLEGDGKTVDLRVGMGLKREDEGDWQKTTEPPDVQSTSQESSPKPETAAKTEPAPSAEESDILKRLLERRQQEMQK